MSCIRDGRLVALTNARRVEFRHCKLVEHKSVQGFGPGPGKMVVDSTHMDYMELRLPWSDLRRMSRDWRFTTSLLSSVCIRADWMQDVNSLREDANVWRNFTTRLFELLCDSRPLVVPVEVAIEAELCYVHLSRGGEHHSHCFHPSGRSSQHVAWYDPSARSRRMLKVISPSEDLRFTSRLLTYLSSPRFHHLKLIVGELMYLTSPSSWECIDTALMQPDYTSLDRVEVESGDDVYGEHAQENCECIVELTRKVLPRLAEQSLLGCVEIRSATFMIRTHAGDELLGLCATN